MLIGTLFVITSVDADDSSFRWMNNCGYTGYDLVSRYNINSLLQCAKACINTKDCNFFTFAPPNCSLKKISDVNQAIPIQDSICGIIASRITNKPSAAASRGSGRQWKTSEDGTYKWDTGCKYNEDVTDHKIDQNRQIATNVAACAEFCIANPECNYFDVRIFDQGCTLKNSNGFYTEKPSSDFGCGFIPGRRFSNIEILPSKNIKKQQPTTTTTTTQDPFADDQASDIDHWVME